MKLIALTGGVGSGKSTVAAMLKELGAEVIDADEAAHAAYAPGTAGLAAVVAEFGPEYVRDGAIDRARLGELVFHDAAARDRLNAIVHPLVREWMATRTAEAVAHGAGVVVHDIPLLFENGLDHLYALVVLVYVPEEVQVRRLVEGRGLPEARARAMIASQMPMEEKRNRARLVIDNSGDRTATRAQVEKLWRDLSAG
ncbi:MAG TPA: dephospho-CoA kinase [Candidatus Sulfotelmatobacter sp.]|nr:dephospho-CoA kinase [Candidatus Sulfotelmatobacter sp.]